MQLPDPAAVEKLDKLVASLMEKLEKLRATARAMAEYEASMEEQGRSLEPGEG